MKDRGNSSNSTFGRHDFFAFTPSFTAFRIVQEISYQCNSFSNVSIRGTTILWDFKIFSACIYIQYLIVAIEFQWFWWSKSAFYFFIIKFINLVFIYYSMYSLVNEIRTPINNLNSVIIVQSFNQSIYFFLKLVCLLECLLQ